MAANNGMCSDSDMPKLTETRIRRIIQEEINKSSTPTSRPTSLMYQRVQNSLNTTASSVLREFSNNNNHRRSGHSSSHSASSISKSAGFLIGSNKTSPGHPYRLNKGKQKKMKTPVKKGFNVWLLNNLDAFKDDAVDDDCSAEIPFQEEFVLMKGIINIDTQEKEEWPIRQALCDLFRNKFSEITLDSFNYVKRERNKIIFPEVTDTHVWDFNSLKLLAGQGKLYCLLNKPYQTFLKKSDSYNNHHDEEQKYDEEHIKMEEAIKVENPIIVESEDDLPNVLPTTDAQQSTSSRALSRHGTSTTSENTSTSASIELQNCKSLLNELLESKTQSFGSLEDILEFLSSKINNFDSEKLTVDPDDILADAMVYFKHSNFNPNSKLMIKYRKQAGVDTGGVLRQFYSDCWIQLLEGSDSLPALFEGADRRKLLSFNTGILMSGVIKYVGKMFSHAICHSRMGFNHLAPAAYWYVATGDSSLAYKHVKLEDIVYPDVKAYLLKLLDLDITCRDLNSESGFVDLLTECGYTQILTIENRDEILQAIMFHEVISKRTSAMNQLRDGLKILGVLDVLEKYPEMCEPLFVYQPNSLTANNVKGILTFDCSKEIENNVLRYLSSCKDIDRENFVMFVTGAAILPMSITVRDDNNSDGIYTSTCLREITLPSVCNEYSKLSELFKVFQEKVQKAFTAV